MGPQAGGICGDATLASPGAQSPPPMNLPAVSSSPLMSHGVTSGDSMRNQEVASGKPSFGLGLQPSERKAPGNDPPGTGGLTASDTPMYGLVAVIVHTGSGSGSGHYYAYCLRRRDGRPIGYEQGGAVGSGGVQGQKGVPGSTPSRGTMRDAVAVTVDGDDGDLMVRVQEGRHSPNAMLRRALLHSQPAWGPDDGGERDDRQWFMASDKTIRLAGQEEVLSAHASVLFYEKLCK